MSSADTSTLTCPLVRMQIRSEMASTAPNACRNEPRPGELQSWAVGSARHHVGGPQ